MKIEHHGESYSHKGLTAIDCEPCGFMHLWPKQVYDYDQYFSKEKPTYFGSAFSDRYWKSYWHKMYLHNTGHVILDVGTGPGWFLKDAQSFGKTVYGIEPSADAWSQAISHGANVYRGVFTTFKKRETEAFFPDTYNAINMDLVLEHVPDPMFFLKTARKFLTEQGKLIITVPNENSLMQRMVKRGNYWIHPTHNNYFNPETLRRLLWSAGFNVLDTYGDFPMELFLLMGANYLDNPKLGKACHAARKKFEMRFFQVDGEESYRNELQHIYRVLMTCGIGRHITMIGEKP